MEMWQLALIMLTLTNIMLSLEDDGTHRIVLYIGAILWGAALVVGFYVEMLT